MPSPFPGMDPYIESWIWPDFHAAIFGIWPFGVRDPLPPVHVPLDPDVSDVILDLRACMDHVYDFGRYGDQLNYTQAPSLSLRKPDATWARKRLSTQT